MSSQPTTPQLGAHLRVASDPPVGAALTLTNLPPAIDLMTAAALLGIGRTAAYQLVRAGKWPTPVVRLGKLIKIPTAPLLELLGLPPAEAPSAQSQANTSTVARHAAGQP